MRDYRDSRYRLIINLSTEQQKRVDCLRKDNKEYEKNPQQGENRIKYFAALDEIIEIYNPFFEATRKNGNVSKKSKKYYESLEKY